MPYDGFLGGGGGSCSLNGLDHWEALLKAQGDEGSAEMAVTGIIFHYPLHVFAYLEVGGRFLFVQPTQPV
jgi:hypothetical protein